MARLELYLLGPLVVALDGKTITAFKSNKERALLAYLAAEANQSQPREKLAELFWPGWPQQSAMSNLRYALADLRKNIGDRQAQPPFLVVSHDSLQLNTESDCQVDVAEFDLLLGDANRPGFVQNETTLSHLQAAVDLYRGPFLQGFPLLDSAPFEELLNITREQYQRQALQALSLLADHHEQLGEYEQALPYAYRQVEIELWLEEAHQQIMRLLASSGRRSEALAQYEICRKALKDELGVEPADETTRLYKSIRDGQFDGPGKDRGIYSLIPTPLIPDTPIVLPRAKHNLPRQLTRFIGREKEISQVKTFLGENSLVTLTGSGGVGKTRLALKVAEGVLADYTDGVWFVDLAPLADPTLVPQKVAFTLGVREEPNRPILNSLASYLLSRQVLFVLDNCEHLLEACAQLADQLLHGCPRLNILASSREPLGVAGEAVFRVPSLPFPDPRKTNNIERLEDYAAIRLFVDRARLVLPDYRVTAQNAPFLVHICQRVDGIPLAIELAAARMNLLTAEQLAERLNDTFHLLVRGSRTALPRQQTLKATIDWSYRLLNEKERLLFRRLSVFAGGCTLEAAEAVCSMEGLDTGEILDLLGSLVDKSMVLAERRPGEETRYHMLETVRQYAASLLQEAKEELVEIKDRHADWFQSQAENPPSVVQNEITLGVFLETMHNNLRNALAWSIEQKNALRALRLVNALGGFWNMHSHNQEGYRWTKQALDLAEGDPALFHSVWWAFAVFSLFFHILTTDRDIAAILPYMEEAYAILREQGKWYDSVFAVQQLGLAEANLGRWGAAERYFRESLELHERFSPDSDYSFPLLCLGVAVAERGEYAASREYFRKSIEVNKRHAVRMTAEFTAIFYAEDLLLQGQLPASRELCAEAIRISEDIGMGHDKKRYLLHMGKICLVEGEFARAREWSWKAYQIEAEYGGKASMPYLAEIDLYESRLAEAEAKALDARDWARAGNTSYPLFNTEFHVNLLSGRVALLRGDPINARPFLDEAHKLFAKVIWNKNDRYYPLILALARAARLEGRFSEARGLYDENLQHIQAAQHYLHAPENLEGMAMLEGEQGRWKWAARLFGSAHALRERMSTPLPPCLQAEYENYQARLRGALGQDTLDHCWRESQSLSIEEIARGLEGGLRDD